MGETWKYPMRFTILLSVLLLAGCTIHAGEFGTRDEANDGFSLIAQDPAETSVRDKGVCDCLVWRGSQYQDYLDGVHGPFCR